MRFFRWLKRIGAWIARRLTRDYPPELAPVPDTKLSDSDRPYLFDPFPIGPKPEYRKKPPGLPGSKVARRMMKVRGLPYNGEVFHTGELTEANNERARRRAEAR